MRETFARRAQVSASLVVIEMTILIVDDEPLVVEALKCLLPPGMRYKVARTVAEALACIDAVEPLHGLALDYGLPDGSGWDVVKRWVIAYPDVPVVIMMGRRHEPELANVAAVFHFQFLFKPFGKDEFGAFTSEVLAARWGLPRAVEPAFTGFVEEKKLTSPQADLLARLDNGFSRRSIAEDLNISQTTVRTRMEQLRQKVGMATVDLVLEKMLRFGASAAAASSRVRLKRRRR